MKKRLLTAGVCLAATLLMAPAAQSADAITVAADACAGCHGTDGRSLGAMPAFHEKKPAELKQILREYKTGKREATIMDRIVKGYSDEQLDAMVDYYTAKK
ncbi:MAG: c-type cytochrome [Alphaproteobacteria bacterium]|nr:c-type cytochrome [Alphaproteobacteria bacterium]